MPRAPNTPVTRLTTLKLYKTSFPVVFHEQPLIVTGRKSQLNSKGYRTDSDSVQVDAKRSGDGED